MVHHLNFAPQTCKITLGPDSYLSLGGGAFLPSGGREFLLQVVRFQRLADHLGLGGVRELHPVLGQVQVVHGVLLAGNSGGWAIDEHLKVREGETRQFDHSTYGTSREAFTVRVSVLEDLSSNMNQAALPNLLVSSVGILHHAREI